VTGRSSGWRSIAPPRYSARKRSNATRSCAAC
jgi:hypothetical protein